VLEERVELGPNVKFHRHACLSFIVTPAYPEVTKNTEITKSHLSLGVLRALRVFGMSRRWLNPRCNEHRERIAGLVRADADAYVAQAGPRQHFLQLVVCEAERAVAELRAHPFFAVCSQIEHDHTAARDGDASRLFD